MLIYVISLILHPRMLHFSSLGMQNLDPEQSAFGHDQTYDSAPIRPALASYKTINGTSTIESCHISGHITQRDERKTIIFS